MIKAGVDFVAVDNRNGNRLTIHLLAAIAEYEREMISQGTKAALAAAKAQGVRLGNPNGAAALLPGCREAAAKAGVVRTLKANQRAAQVAPFIRQLEAEGCTSAKAMAHELDLHGAPAPSGRRMWYPEQVRRMVRRVARLDRTDCDQWSRQI